MKDLIVSIEQEIKSLEKTEGLTVDDIHSRLHKAMKRITNRVKELIPTENASAIAELYYQAEALYLLAAEKIEAEDSSLSDWFRMVSIFWLTMAHQHELLKETRRKE